MRMLACSYILILLQRVVSHLPWLGTWSELRLRMYSRKVLIMTGWPVTTYVYLLGSIARYEDIHMSYETSYCYRNYPVELAKFITPRDGDLWHEIASKIIDLNDNLKHYSETGHDPVKLYLRVLGVLGVFVKEWGKELMPIVIRRIANELRPQFNLPASTWPPIVVLICDEFGV